MVLKIIIPDRDGWYWAIRDGLPQLDSNLELVRFEYAAVWIAGSEVEERPDRWRFYAGPIDPPSLDSAALRSSDASWPEQQARYEASRPSL